MTDPHQPLSPSTAVTVAQLLDFEAKARSSRASEAWKGELIGRELGISPVQYYVLLNRAIDTEPALSHAPQLVHRLQEERRRRNAQTVRRGARILTVPDPTN